MKNKLMLCIIISLLYNALSLCTDKIKLYALYTPSHAILKDQFFLPSIQDDFDIILEFCDQTCSSAQFMNVGWTETTIRKVDLIIRAIKENWGKIFIFSDVDIQFFCPIQDIIINLMNGNDIIMQRNTPDGVLCTGFFACRGNAKTLQLWSDVKKTMHNSNQSDQISFNQCIKRHGTKNPYNITWDYLPNNFFGPGTLLGCSGYLWLPGDTLPIPKNIIMHHANWTKGVKNKIAQLKYVYNAVHKQKNI